MNPEISIMPDCLNKPLVFGDTEQIEALNNIEKRTEKLLNVDYELLSSENGKLIIKYALGHIAIFNIYECLKGKLEIGNKTQCDALQWLTNDIEKKRHYRKWNVEVNYTGTRKLTVEAIDEEDAKRVAENELYDEDSEYEIKVSSMSVTTKFDEYGQSL